MLVGIGFISLITATVAHTLMSRAEEVADEERDRRTAAGLERLERQFEELNRLLREERGR